MISGRGVRRVQLAMALRWIVATCPRKCLGTANKVSIEYVRNVLWGLGDTNPASGLASPTRYLVPESRSLACLPTYRAADALERKHSSRHLAQRPNHGLWVRCLPVWD